MKIVITTILLLLLLVAMPAWVAVREPPAAQPAPKPSSRFEVVRFRDNPILHPGLEGLKGNLGENIDGPSLIRAPEELKVIVFAVRRVTPS